jgi:hypothetical protein
VGDPYGRQRARLHFADPKLVELSHQRESTSFAIVDLIAQVQEPRMCEQLEYGGMVYCVRLGGALGSDRSRLIWDNRRGL